VWVKGHAGNKGNERTDRQAKGTAADELARSRYRHPRRNPTSLPNLPNPPPYALVKTGTLRPGVHGHGQRTAEAAETVWLTRDIFVIPWFG